MRRRAPPDRWRDLELARILEAMADIRWTDEARARLSRVPFFIRPFVRRRAEAVARERGLTEVTSQLLDEIKSKEHER